MPEITFIEPMRARISANVAAKIVGGRKELKQLVTSCRPHLTIFETRPHMAKMVFEPKGRSNIYFLCDTVSSGEYVVRTLAPFMSEEQIRQLDFIPAWLRDEIISS